MKHITGTGCGYDLTGGRTIYGGTFGDWVYGSTHNCKGLDPLNENFLTTEITGSTEHPFDNYSNLPQKIKGFVMTLSPILNMETDNVEAVPEVECTNDFDPVTGTTSYDYYELYKNNNLYVEVNGETVMGSTIWDTVYTEVDGSTTAVYEMSPGALEPMIDTSFPPIGVDAPPFTDLNITGGYIPIRLLGGWQDMIVGKINDLYRKSWGNYDKGLNELISKDEEASECDNFRISLATTVTKVRSDNVVFYVTPNWIAEKEEAGEWPGDYTIMGEEHTTALVEGEAEWTANRQYDVSPGVVYIDGKTIHVDGLYSIPVQAEDFEVYLEIDPEKVANNEEHAAILRSGVIGALEALGWRVDGRFYVFVGNVRRIYSAGASDAKAYTLFKITQGDCIADITLPGGTSGDVYNGPFHVKKITNGIEIECLRTKNNSCIDVGEVFINGITHWTETNQKISGSTYTSEDDDSQYVYAHVTASTVTFDTNPDADGTPPPYTVRLARIKGAVTTSEVIEGTTVYTLSGDITVDQWHHGDIYVDGRWM